MIHLYDSTRLPSGRWHNGGGETRQIVSLPASVTQFDWRISIAILTRDGDFSLFPDIDRIITLLHGEVMLSDYGRRQQPLKRHQPFAFYGGMPVAATLAGKTSEVFNIMAWRGVFHPTAGISTRAFSPLATDAGVAYVISGQWRNQHTLLSSGQGAWWEHSAGVFIPVSARARLLWGILTPCRHFPQHSER